MTLCKNANKTLNIRILIISLYLTIRINEFGYKIEPFNMKNDREEG
jgi:hypothetical protein